MAIAEVGPYSGQPDEPLPPMEGLRNLTWLLPAQEVPLVLSEVLSDASRIASGHVAIENDEQAAKQMAAGCLEKLEEYISNKTKQPPEFYFCLENILHNMAHQHFLHQAASLPSAVAINRIDFEKPSPMEQKRPITVLRIGNTLLRGTPQRYSNESNPALVGKLHGIEYTAKRLPRWRSIGGIFGFELR